MNECSHDGAGETLVLAHMPEVVAESAIEHRDHSEKWSLSKLDAQPVCVVDDDDPRRPPSGLRAVNQIG
jgi:hypothetical protein